MDGVMPFFDERRNVLDALGKAGWSDLLLYLRLDLPRHFAEAGL